MQKLSCGVLAVLAITMIGIRLAKADQDHREATLRATLVGANETPPISTDATGSFKATVFSDGNITFRLTFSNLRANITQSHIHFAQKNVPGGIMIFLCGPAPATGSNPWQVCPAAQSGVVEGPITTDNVVALAAQGIAVGDLAAALRAIAQGEGYANVHSTLFPAGEIRGQVRVRGDLDKDDDD
jgi:CHRD domain-containing protein